MQLKRFPVRLRRRRTGPRRRAEALRKAPVRGRFPSSTLHFCREPTNGSRPDSGGVFRGRWPRAPAWGAYSPDARQSGKFPKSGKEQSEVTEERDRNDAVPRTLRRGPFPPGLVGGTGGRAGPFPSGGQRWRPPRVGGRLRIRSAFRLGVGSHPVPYYP